ncbi:MAG: GH3 auxin-responsive promoter family protein [Bacteroidia bacterium]
MGVIGLVLKNGLGLTRYLPAQKGDTGLLQVRELQRLLQKAANTEFGKEYRFNEILKQADIVAAFRQRVPVHSYEDMSRWWQLCLQGESSVTWPGKVAHFALSSGTSEGASKYIPVTRSMLAAIQRASIRQMLSLAKCDLPRSFFEKDIMMLGGSTSLDYNGIHYAGDLSGITTGNLPIWFQPFYKPGKRISANRNWQEKLDAITEQAHKWDVAAVVGVPSWIQLLMERIISHYKVETIHDVWPNLMVFTHGGVSFDPYKRSFEKLLGKPLIYLETYLASEGFIAYQAEPGAGGMRMLLRNRIFYEFIPFNNNNFDSTGNLEKNPEALTWADAEEGKDYALIMSTCAGAWRYLIGDVIRIISKEKQEIRIIGRTKQFLSLAGEHLSVENMNKGIELTAAQMNIHVTEFTVAGVPENSGFAHHWFIGTNDKDTDPHKLTEHLDSTLATLNDDYRVVRQNTLKRITVTIVSPDRFRQWLKKNGKEGAQIKFPRVLKEAQFRDWREFLSESADSAGAAGASL